MKLNEDGLPVSVWKLMLVYFPGGIFTLTLLAGLMAGCGWGALGLAFLFSFIGAVVGSLVAFAWRGLGKIAK